MNLVAALLVITGIIISFLATGFLIIWLRGVGLFMFPGLGFVVSTPFVAVLLLIAEIVVVLLAIVAKSASVNP